MVACDVWEWVEIQLLCWKCGRRKEDYRHLLEREKQQDLKCEREKQSNCKCNAIHTLCNRLTDCTALIQITLNNYLLLCDAPPTGGPKHVAESSYLHVHLAALHTVECGCRQVICRWGIGTESLGCHTARTAAEVSVGQRLIWCTRLWHRSD